MTPVQKSGYYTEQLSIRLKIVHFWSLERKQKISGNETLLFSLKAAALVYVIITVVVIIFGSAVPVCRKHFCSRGNSR